MAKQSKNTVGVRKYIPWVDGKRNRFVPYATGDMHNNKSWGWGKNGDGVEDFTITVRNEKHEVRLSFNRETAEALVKHWTERLCKSL